MVILIYTQQDHSLVEAGGSKPEESEDVGMFHEVRMWMSCVCLPQYFAHLFSWIYSSHKLQLHLSQNELFGVRPVVHKGVHIWMMNNMLYWNVLVSVGEIVYWRNSKWPPFHNQKIVYRLTHIHVHRLNEIIFNFKTRFIIFSLMCCI